MAKNDNRNYAGERRQAESYQEKIGGNLHLAVNELAKTIGESEKAVDEFGRLTEEGAKAFSELLGQAGKEQIKAQRDIIKSTNKFQANLEKSFNNFAKRIPVIGKDLEKGFSKMMKNMTVKMDQLLTKTWGRLGAGMKGAMKIGAGGIVAAGALVLKQFHEIEKSTVELSKQTGLTGKNLKGLTTNMIAAQSSGYKFGISMQDSAEATAAMVKSLGSFRRVSTEMIKTASLLAKYAGISNTEAGEFVGVMIKGFGKTSKDVMQFGNTMKDFATRSGVNSRKVMADIMQNTNLTAIYMSKGEGFLKKAAVQAAKLNMSMQETADATEMFLDIDQSAEVVGKINQYMGSSLNSLELFNLRAKGDTEAVMKRLGQAFASPRGIRFMEEMPGLANKFGKEMGFNLKQMRVMAGLEKDHSKVVKAEATEQETIAEAVAMQQTKFEQISNTFKQAVFPMVNSLAEKLVNFTNMIGPSGIKIGMGVAAGAGLLMIGKFMLSGRFPGTAPWVRVAGGIPGVGGGGGGARGGGGGGRGGYDKAGRYRNAQGQFAKPGMMAKAGQMMAGSGVMSKGLGMAKGLMKGPIMGAIMMVPSLLAAIDTGQWSKMIPAILGWAGGALGFAGGGALMGVLTGGIGALPAGIAGGYAGNQAGEWLGNKIIGAKKGAMVNKPTLFMAGEEGLPEMIIPTGRMAKGMPINKDVVEGLGGLGVPGFPGGRYGATAGMRSSAGAQAAAAAAQTTQMGSMADPQTQRVRQIQYEQDVQKRKSDQRASMRLIEEKSLAILEEERNIAMDVGGPIGNFANKLGLWEKAKEAAGKYAKKTADRFWENLKKNNNDVMGALKDTWTQTVGDLKNLQARLYQKLGDFARSMAARGQAWAEGKLKDVGGRILNWSMGKLGINNAATRQQFTGGLMEGIGQGRDWVASLPALQGVKSQLGDMGTAFRLGRGGDDLAGKIIPVGTGRTGGVGDTFLNRQAHRAGGVLGLGDEGMAKVGKGATLAAAALPGILKGDLKGAGKGMAMSELKGRAGAKVGGLFSKGSKAGGYATAAATGMMEGIASGDLKAAGKGALEGAVGHGIGIAATTVLTPFLGPAAPVVGKMLGAIVAGPATKGILAGGKQMTKGLGNVWGGLKGGGFKQMGRGVLQIMGSGHKAALVATKELGKMVGIGRGSSGWKPAEARAKTISQMMQVQRAKSGNLLTRGGVFTTKKWQEGMRKAVKMSDTGKPDAAAMSTMIADIVRIFGVTPDIAQTFIFAALGATMPESVKSDIENELTGGWGEKVKGGGWQADYDAGKLRQDWKAIRSKGGKTDEASQAASAHMAGQKMDRLASAAAGGFNLAELREHDMLNKFKGGNDSGIGKTGNVYLDGVLVGVVSGSAAAGAAIDGIPANIVRAGADRSLSSGWRQSNWMSGAAT